ncbi:hypothetical protein AKO1_015496 [Acrasis kona]|uniref:Uncharacterized protein n=1 Tax=Acrasis kona TaxID=1008807 RepID=A0AAW2ZER6_9EUKA
MNHIYADVSGNIGYVHSGGIPVRKQGHSGAFPVAGNSSSMKPTEYLKPLVILNPDSGYISSSNNRVEPYGSEQCRSMDYQVHFRAQRIKQLINDKNNGSLFHVDDFKIIQNDSVNMYFVHLKPMLHLLGDFMDHDDAKNELLNLLQWDGVMSKGSKSASVFELWIAKLNKIVCDQVGTPYGGTQGYYFILDILLYNTSDKACRKSDCLRHAAEELQDVVRDLHNHYNEIPEWGNSGIHISKFKNMLLDGTPLECYACSSLITSGGTEIVSTPSPNEIDHDKLKITTISSPIFRLIADLSGAGQFSWSLNQDGNILSSEFNDNIRNWIDFKNGHGQYHSILNSRHVKRWRYDQTLEK